MANKTILKKAFISGLKGEKGDDPQSDTTLPKNGVIFYDSEVVPAGYADITPTPPELEGVSINEE